MRPIYTVGQIVRNDDRHDQADNGSKTFPAYSSNFLSRMVMMSNDLQLPAMCTDSKFRKNRLGVQANKIIAMILRYKCTQICPTGQTSNNVGTYARM